MKRVISIVEDERDLNELVKRYLEKEGYEARSYLTYDEASLHTGDDDVHLWILDIMLGDKSGFDLIEDIRRRNPNVPVIFMSARDKEFDRIIGLEKGSDDYITKPFSPKELVLRVNNIMRRTYRSGDEKITVDGYTIDEGKRVAYDTEGNDIDLSTKEYELLMLFVKNRGTAFSRDQILRQVWETNYYGSDRVVDDTMRRLRKKMPDLNIHTIYGFGYRLG
ncbi:MAG: response regulator transcription factor [Solobacterium sp.]|nr:response regulator transcription factor [Solobacterium sp.]